VITSTANSRIKSVRELHRGKVRRLQGRTLIEGHAVFAEFLAAGFRPVTVLCEPHDTATIDACHRSNIGFTLVTRDVLASASDTRAPQGPVAVIEIPQLSRLRLHNTLVLVDIQDPGNVGTMIRTSAAFGWDVAYTAATAEPWAPKTVRSAAGSHTRVGLILLTDPLEELSETGLHIVASVIAGGSPPSRSHDAVALLVGSEAHGLDREMVERADTTMTIPMPGGTESLNAAISAAIALFALT